MSWKIFGAYKYSADINKLVEDLNEIRQWHREFVLEDCARAYDGLTEKGKAELSWQVVHNDLLSAHEEHHIPIRCSITNMMLDTRGSAVVYVRPEGLYVQFYTSSEVEEKIDKHPRFSDWHWQNSCDKPDEVSNKEWQEREDFWRDLFEKESSPSSIGLIREFSDFRLRHELGQKIMAKLWPDKYKYPQED